MIDQEFAVGTGDIRSGDGKRRGEGFQQGLEDMIGLPALRDGLVEIAEDAERNLGIEVPANRTSASTPIFVALRSPGPVTGGKKNEKAIANGGMRRFTGHGFRSGSS